MTQVNTLGDLNPGLWNLINQWFISWSSWWKKVLEAHCFIALLLCFIDSAFFFFFYKGFKASVWEVTADVVGIAGELDIIELEA